MPVLRIKENKSLWDTICEDFESKKNLIEKDKDEIVDFDPEKHNHVFFGQAYKLTKVDVNQLLDFDPSVSHPACVGYSIQQYQAKSAIKESSRPALDKKKCTETEYLEEFIFPVLLPALEQVLIEAKKHKCFERKRTAFNACDFITEYLYKNNINQDRNERASIGFWEIPFVQEWSTLHQRKPLPKSLIWTEEEAALKIQAFYRGYLIRRDPEVQELRKWQRELREENQNIVERVERFWNDSSNFSNQKESSYLEMFAGYNPAASGHNYGSPTK